MGRVIKTEGIVGHNRPNPRTTSMDRPRHSMEQLTIETTSGASEKG